MDRVGREEFTPSLLVYTSTFSVSVDTIDAADGLTSDRCGLGWSFELRRDPPPLGRLISRNRPVGSVGNAFLKLQIDPWTVTLGKRLSIDRICCTVIVDVSFGPPNNLFTVPDRQTFNKTMRLSLSSLVSTIGDLSFPMSSPSHGRNLSSSPTLTLRMTVELLTDPEAATSELLKHALSDSIISGDLLDIKFYLYSKRYGDRGAHCPRPLFSSSHILRKLGDLDVFFASEGFKGSEDVAIDLYHVGHDDLETAMYEYDSDSDLEDEECLEKEEERQAIEASEDDQGDLRNDLEQLQAGSNVDFLRTGRVIFMKDIAFRTWNAFINHVYFDEIKFSKLQSTYPDVSQASTRFADQKQCSPKSMYRLADKFGIDALKKLALDNIRSQLTKENIFKEVFSRFTSKYPEVLSAEVAFLMKNCSNTVIQSSLSQALDRFGSPGDQHLRYALQKIVAGLSKPRK